MRKFCKILNIFLVVIVLLAVSGGVANAQRVKFEKVDLKQGLSVNPVRLNKNEIFIPGGWGENLKDVLLTAKIYKIKEKKLEDLHSMMKVPRFQYSSVAYDEEHVLVLGGYCPLKEENSNASCCNVAEIYDKTNNTFTRISDSNLEYDNKASFMFLKDGNILIYERSDCEMFNPKTKTFTILPISTDDDTYDPWNSILLPLNEEKALVFARYSPIISVLDLKEKKLYSIEDNDTLLEGNVPCPALIDNDTLLFVGAGENNKNVVSFRISDETFHDYGEILKRPLNSLETVVLDNNKIAMVYGRLDVIEGLWGRAVERAVYDYKYNKITKVKDIKDWERGLWYSHYLYKLDGSSVLYLERTLFHNIEALMEN